MRALIRVASTKFDEWLNGTGSKEPKALASGVFPLKTRRGGSLLEESVYETNGPREETEAVAAHLLADSRPKAEARYCIRFREEDLSEAGMDADRLHFGTTGIVRVDFAHRDLIGTREQFHRLVEVVLRKIQEGEDRVRRLGKPQLRSALERFAAAGSVARPEPTARLIARVLADQPPSEEGQDLEAVRAGLASVGIPDEAVRLRAFCLHEGGRGTGRPEGDWLRAAEELKGLYCAHYLAEVLGVTP